VCVSVPMFVSVDFFIKSFFILFVSLSLQLSRVFSLSTSSQARPISLLEHDMVIWTGDLNYRIDVADLDTVYVYQQLLLFFDFGGVTGCIAVTTVIVVVVTVVVAAAVVVLVVADDE
jgi:hypothetical protein